MFSGSESHRAHWPHFLPAAAGDFRNEIYAYKFLFSDFNVIFIEYSRLGGGL
jgi:hypothetical protein